MSGKTIKTPTVLRYKYRQDGGAWSDWASVVTDTSGKFRISGLDAEKVDVRTEIIYTNVVKGGSGGPVIGVNQALAERFFEQNYIEYDKITAKVVATDLSVADDQYLNMLLAWGEGEIERVEDIQINGQDLEFYLDASSNNNLDVEHAMGTVDQPTIGEFDAATTAEKTSFFPVELGREDNTSATITITNDSADRVILGFKTLLYNTTEDGIFNGNIKIRIEAMPAAYGKTVEQNWVNHADFSRQYTITSKTTQYQYRSLKLFSIPKGLHHIRISREKHDYIDEKCASVFIWQYCNTQTDIGYRYPGTALTAVRALATSNLSGPTPEITGTIYGLKIEAPKLTVGGQPVGYHECYWDDFTKQYRHIGSAAHQFGDVAVWDGTLVKQWSPNPFWIYYNLLTNEYWGLGDKVAPEQVEFAAIADGAQWADELVLIDASRSFRFDAGAVNNGITINSITYTATTITIGTTPAPSWPADGGEGVFIEIMSGAGAGQIRVVTGNTTNGQVTISPAFDVVPAAGDSFAVYPEVSKRFEFHGTFDTFSRVVDAFNDLLFCCRSYPAGIGPLYTVVSDRPKPVTDILNMSTILAGSFSESMSLERPTHFRGEFLDQENGYETAVYELMDSHGPANPGGFKLGDKRSEANYFMFGFTMQSRVVRELRYIRDKARHCTRQMEAGMMLDKITAMPGDVILVAHDVAGWGDGSRVKGSGSNFIDIVGTVEIWAGKSYTLTVRSGQAVTEYAVDAAGTVAYAGGSTTGRIYINGAFSGIPVAFSDLWILTNNTDSVGGKLFMVESIRRKNDNSATVVLLEYNETVYDDLPVQVTQMMSSIPSVIPPAPPGVNFNINWKDMGGNWTPFLTIEIDPVNSSTIGIGGYRIMADFEEGDTAILPDQLEHMFNSDTNIIEVPAMPYDEKTLFVKVAAISKTGVLGIFSPIFYQYIDVTAVAPVVDIENTSITNAKLYYQPGKTYSICSFSWEYIYDTPAHISGYAIIYRIQKHHWSWKTTSVVDANSMAIPWLDLGDEGMATHDAAKDLTAQMASWKSDPVKKECYFGFFSPTTDAHEIVRVDMASVTVADIEAAFWTIMRGQEGTTAQAWPVGTTFSYVPCEYVDAFALHADTTKTSVSLAQPIEIKQALHASICAFKEVPIAPGFRRSNLSVWTPEAI